MRKIKQKARENVRILLTWIFSVFIIVGLTISSASVFAASDNQGDRDSAMKKLYLRTLKGCATELNWNGWHHGGLEFGKNSTVKSKDLQSGKWFSDFWALGDWDATSAITWYGGAIVENAVAGYDDGKIYCGEKDNAMLNQALSTLGVSKLDLICNYKDGHTGGGLLYVDGTSSTCDDQYNNADYSKWIHNTNSAAYLDDLATNKVFGGNVPGGDVNSLTDLETYYILYDTFTTACASGGPHVGNTSLAYQVQYWNGSSFEPAGYSQKNPPDHKVYTYFGNQSTCQEIADSLNSGKYFEAYKAAMESEDPPEPTPTPTPTPNPDDPDTPVDVSDEEKCYAESKSLGWVICPIVFGLREMVDNFYSAVEPLIMTNSSIVEQLGDNGSGLYSAWAIFRGFANVLFVIFFMVIIFSQLTGFGIDNYGIKKMLPKLIITALLVNLSFWICAIAVDISNVVGVGIKNMLENVGNGIFANFGGSSAHAVGYLGNRAVGWVTGAVTGGVILGVAFALEGWALIIPILLFLLTMVIAIFFALIILGLRQALVVILIVLAPLALACTILPNTESLYKKWFGAAKGILMVFPIAAGIIGAGYLTASILMSSDDGFIMTIVSGVLMVGPYFLIPSLTKKALDTIGNASIGSRIGNFGKHFGDRAKSGINNTDAVRNAKAGSKDLNRRLGAGLYMKTFGKSTGAKLAAGKKVRKGSAERYARNAQIAGSRSQANIAARQAQSQYNRLQGSGFDAAMSAAAMNEDATTTKNWETMLAAGDYSYDTGQVDADGKAVMQKVDSQNNNQIAAALEHELMQKGDKYDANKVRALSNALAAKGKEGRNLMYNTVSNAQKNGASAQAVKDFSGNIMNNHAGTMKEKARSLYEFAKNTADAEIDSNGNVVAQYQKNKDGTDKLVNGQKVLAAGYTQDSSGKVSLSNVESFAAAGTGSLTAGDMTSMDKQQLQRYADNASGDTLKTLGTLANQALTDDHLSQNLSKDNRTLLETIRTNATKAGYNVGAGSMQGRSENFHDRSNTQPKLVSDETRQKIADNGRLNPEVERAIKEVENPAPKNIVVPGQNNNNGGQSSLIDPKTGRPFEA